MIHGVFQFSFELILPVCLNSGFETGFDFVYIQEAKPYKNDPEILAMTNLVTAYQNNDINEFEKILKQNRQTIMEDTFIREHIEDLLKNIRTQVPYEFLINTWRWIFHSCFGFVLSVQRKFTLKTIMTCIPCQSPWAKFSIFRVKFIIIIFHKYTVSSNPSFRPIQTVLSLEHTIRI